MIKKKNIAFTAVVLLLFCVMLYGFSLILDKPYSNGASESKAKKRTLSTFGTQSHDVPDSNDDNWQLILVNHYHSIPENYQPELMELDCGKMIDSRIYPYLQEMFDDMRKDGIYPDVWEGYRTAQEQEQIMTDKINAYIYEGYSYDDAEKAASLAVAEVGKSEHQLGLALDINADEAYSTHQEVYEWLAENSYKYGFILRYPENKAFLTGIEYEPWHYRFVGLKTAREIYDQGLCLEEYIEK